MHTEDCYIVPVPHGRQTMQHVQTLHKGLQWATQTTYGWLHAIQTPVPNIAELSLRLNSDICQYDLLDIFIIMASFRLYCYSSKWMGTYVPEIET